MSLPTYNFGLTIRFPIGHALEGQPYSGCNNAELRKGETVIDLNEIGSTAFYFASGVPAGKWMLWVNNISSGQSFGIGEGELAGLGYDSGKTLKSLSDKIEWSSTDAVTWETLTGKPTSFNPATHGHAIADVSGLNAAFDAKANTIHTHTMSQITGSPIAPLIVETDGNGTDNALKIRATGSTQSFSVDVATQTPKMTIANGDYSVEAESNLLKVRDANNSVDITADQITVHSTTPLHNAVLTPTDLTIDGVSITGQFANKEPLVYRASITAATDFLSLAPGYYRVTGGTMHPNNTSAYTYGRLDITAYDGTNKLVTYYPHRGGTLNTGGARHNLQYNGAWCGWTKAIDQTMQNNFVADQRFESYLGVYESLSYPYASILLASQADALAPGILAGPGGITYDTSLVRPSPGLWYTPNAFEINGTLSANGDVRLGGADATGWLFSDSGGVANIWNAGLTASPTNYALRSSTNDTIINSATSTGDVAIRNATANNVVFNATPIGQASLSDATATYMGGYGTTAWAIWSGNITPSTTNYGLYLSPTTAEISGTTYSYLSVGSAGRVRAGASNVLISPTSVTAEQLIFMKYTGSSAAAIYNGAVGTPANNNWAFYSTATSTEINGSTNSNVSAAGGTVVQFSQDPTARSAMSRPQSAYMGGYGTSGWGLWNGDAKPTTTNYALYVAPTQTQLNATSNVYLSIGDSIKVDVSSSSLTAQTGVKITSGSTLNGYATTSGLPSGTQNTDPRTWTVLNFTGQLTGNLIINFTGGNPPTGTVQYVHFLQGTSARTVQFTTGVSTTFRLNNSGTNASSAYAANIGTVNAYYVLTLVWVATNTVIITNG